MGSEERYGIEDLLEIMQTLRGENGCPWDREQDHRSIRSNVIEEAYEVADAIDRSDPSALCEELGDLLLQVVFHARMEEEAGGFDFNDVCDGICKKLILRHPHVFADVKVDSSSQVLDNWEAIKKVEKHQESFTDTLSSVPVAFPAVMRAQKVQKRACKASPALNTDVAVTTARLRLAVEEFSRDPQDRQAAGDMLFLAAAAARCSGADGEELLQEATGRFINRFSQAEESLGDGIKELDGARAEGIWGQAPKNK